MGSKLFVKGKRRKARLCFYQASDRMRKWEEWLNMPSGSGFSTREVMVVYKYTQQVKTLVKLLSLFTLKWKAKPDGPLQSSSQLCKGTHFIGKFIQIDSGKCPGRKNFTSHIKISMTGHFIAGALCGYIFERQHRLCSGVNFCWSDFRGCLLFETNTFPWSYGLHLKTTERFRTTTGITLFWLCSQNWAVVLQWANPSEAELLTFENYRELIER